MAVATREQDVPGIVDALIQSYDQAVAALRHALARYLTSGEKPSHEDRARGLFAYPELRVEYRVRKPTSAPGRAFGRLNQLGVYSTSVARPRLFRQYLIEQLTYLVSDYEVEISTAASASEIPYAYALDGADDLRLDGVQAIELGQWFPTTELAHIGDEIADGEWDH